MNKVLIVLLVLFLTHVEANVRQKRQLFATCLNIPGAYCDYYCRSGYTEDPTETCGLITAKKCCTKVSTPPAGLTTIVPSLGQCGIGKYGSQTGQTSDGSRIVGGEDAYQNEFPWQVSLQIDSSHFCGASIISKSWILTAGHCFTGLNPDSSYTKSRIRVVVGEHRLMNAEGTEFYAKVSKIIVHPSYNSRNISNDVALIKLTEPLEFDSNVREVCVAKASVGAVDRDEVIVTGWGLTQENGNIPNTLQKVRLLTMTNTQCNTDFSGTGAKVDGTMLCADGASKDSCQGDSGGPLIMQADRGSQQFIQVGIVSWGIGCARDTPGVYTRVSYFADWILATMAAN